MKITMFSSTVPFPQEVTVFSSNEKRTCVDVLFKFCYDAVTQRKLSVNLIKKPALALSKLSYIRSSLVDVQHSYNFRPCLQNGSGENGVKNQRESKMDVQRQEMNWLPFLEGDFPCFFASGSMK